MTANKQKAGTATRTDAVIELNGASVALENWKGAKVDKRVVQMAANPPRTKKTSGTSAKASSAGR